MADGQRILVAEDEALIAMDLAAELEENGFSVVGPAGNEATAVELIGANCIDFAILDINLGAATSFGLAKILKDRRIDFLFLSGYEQNALPPEFAGCVVLSKPISYERLIRAIRR